MTKKVYALLSVSDKTNIDKIAQVLSDRDISLLSTGGTYDALKAFGFDTEKVESVTGFPEMMDGRVKTLHPKIHGGLLADMSNEEHVFAMKNNTIPQIDYAIVNLYPFERTVTKKDVAFNDAIEHIDIGGPTLLRSAAKNHERVTVITDPKDYEAFINQMQTNGKTSLSFRQYLAKKVFQLTAHYDSLIAEYLDKTFEADESENSWPHLTQTYTKIEDLRYGENSHQSASLYKNNFSSSYAITEAKQLHGKKMSYNNIKDTDAALKLIREFNEPCAVAVKHMNPCGVAIGGSIEEAFDRCYVADSVSIYGGIVAVNRPVTKALAEKLYTIYLEVVIAPAFSPEALDILDKKKNIRLLTVDFEQSNASYSQQLTTVSGGVLVQSEDYSSEFTDQINVLDNQWEILTKKVPNIKEYKAMNFGMKVAKHVKSNAIVVSNDYMTLGIGTGQSNRVGAARLALDQAVEKEENYREVFVMSSDGFLPMDDTVTMASDYGISAVAQPGGSIYDDDSVKICNERDMSMVKTHVRHFRH